MVKRRYSTSRMEWPLRLGYVRVSRGSTLLHYVKDGVRYRRTRNRMVPICTVAPGDNKRA